MDTGFIDYIKENKLPADKEEATRVVRRSKNYVLDKLYRRAASSGVLLKCVSFEEGKEILDEIHSGCCGNHAASRTLVGKAFRTGFYWPTALKDVEELVRKCKGCQMFARQAHVPAHNLICIPPAWPFSCWGLDRRRGRTEHTHSTRHQRWPKPCMGDGPSSKEFPA